MRNITMNNKESLEEGDRILQGEIFRVLGQEVEEEVEDEAAWLITFHTKIWKKKKNEKQMRFFQKAKAKMSSVIKIIEVIAQMMESTSSIQKKIRKKKKIPMRTNKMINTIVNSNKNNKCCKVSSKNNSQLLLQVIHNNQIYQRQNKNNKFLNHIFRIKNNLIQ